MIEYVYFLDDDTTLHPDLFSQVKDLNHDFIHFNQVTPDGKPRIGGLVKVNHIDTGSVLAKLNLISDIRWKTDLYNADGYFWEAAFARAKSPLYINKPLSIYNSLNQ